MHPTISRRSFLQLLGAGVSSLAIVPYVPQQLIKADPTLVWVDGLVRGRAIQVDFRDLCLFIKVMNDGFQIRFNIQNGQPNGDGCNAYRIKGTGEQTCDFCLRGYCYRKWRAGKPIPHMRLDRKSVV